MTTPSRTIRTLHLLLCAAAAAACHDGRKGGEADPAATDDEGYSAPCADPVLEPFPLHFVVLTASADPGVPSATSVIGDGAPYGPWTGEEVFHDGEVDVLNAEFRSDLDGDGVPEPVCDADGCVTFEYADHVFHADIGAVDPSCDALLALGDPPDTDNLSNDAEAAVNACDDPILVRDGVINVFVYDLQGSNNSRARMNCAAGSGADCRPYAFYDFARFPHVSAVEEHEMGHAFGLAHVCDPDVVKTTDPSNIMEGVDCPVPGSPDGPSEIGTRELKFEQWQVDEILGSARQMREEWCEAGQG